VNAVGPLRQIAPADVSGERRYLLIAPAAGAGLGAPVQIQREEGRKAALLPGR
jgi:hypothetical protein